mgnify:CR=1 FL=1
MPSWIVAVLLGIIEGLTEFIPVSSTGHLLLAEQWLPKQSDLFNVFIQSGAMLALLPIFSRRLREMAFGLGEPENRDLLGKLAAAFLITGIGGYAMKKFGFVLPHDPMPVAWATLIGGFVILGIERWLKGRELPDRITWAVAAVLIPAAAILGGAALSCVTKAGAASIGNAGPHGFSEILYALTSAAANNGSAFAGLNANTDFYNLLTALAMLTGRFAVIVPALAIAGSLAAKKTAPPSAGTFPTDGVTFALLLMAVVLIVGALTFFPALSLGPVAEHFLVRAGRTF